MAGPSRASIDSLSRTMSRVQTLRWCRCCYGCRIISHLRLFLFINYILLSVTRHLTPKTMLNVVAVVDAITIYRSFIAFDCLWLPLVRLQTSPNMRVKEMISFSERVGVWCTWAQLKLGDVIVQMQFTGITPRLINTCFFFFLELIPISSVIIIIKVVPQLCRRCYCFAKFEFEIVGYAKMQAQACALK